MGARSNKDRRDRAKVSVEADAEGVAALIGSSVGVGAGIGDLMEGRTVESVTAEVVRGVAEGSLRAEAREAASREREVARRRGSKPGLRGAVLAEDSRRRAEALEAIAEGGVPSLEAAAAVTGSQSLATRRSDVEAILASAGVELGVSLTSRDTAGMLAALLTCGEAQLESVMADPRTPLAVKTVVKRLCMDYRDGSTATIERLWDRIFGKAPLSEAGARGQAGGPSVVPSGPVSRQAYEMIRVRYIGEEVGDGE